MEAVGSYRGFLGLSARDIWKVMELDDPGKRLDLPAEIAVIYGAD